MSANAQPPHRPAPRHRSCGATYDGEVKARSALVYSVLRLLAFLVPFGILMLLPIFREYYWLAAIFAALIGLSLSLLFLRRPLDEVSTALAQRRVNDRDARSDEEVEDAPSVTPSAADEGPAEASDR